MDGSHSKDGLSMEPGGYRLYQKQNAVRSGSASFYVS